ncbi:MAG TPA: DUF6600 domain-containing protein, partial [Pyrinomonadaceae bacterium]|nr:DUF6600 domain-containing protein [Pyrinomonadaceae bacterium]
DDWVADRERYLAERFRYDTDRYDSYVWGAEDLDAYGNWSYVNDYGWIWRPHVTIINNYSNWAPYRYGTWTWVSPYGWTWVGYEPWGWAPYHYGRWVYYNNYWAWCPRSYYYRHRSWWRPALVAFNISIGNHISWYPLSYHRRDPRSRRYDISKNAGRQQRRPTLDESVYHRAVTTASTKDFGADGVPFKGVNVAVARRIIGEAPVTGDLPLRPANVYSQKTNGTASDVTTRVTAAKQPVKPVADIVERPTGAAIRKAGVPLDAELRRTRVFGGRDVKLVTPETGVNEGAIESRSTGAVTRPPKTITNDSIDQGGATPRGDKGAPRVPRADTTDGTGVIKRDQGYKGRREPVDGDTVSPPVSSPKSEPDSGRPAKTIQSQPRERDETPSPNYEPPKKYEPQPRSEPAPRYEPPKQSEPAKKYEPPPQRSESPPRAAPEPKSNPAPRKSEPAKVQPPRKVDPT